jgi:hypothetical protein
MSHIPTEADLATKRDMTHLESHFETRMDGFEGRMDRFETRMDRLDARMERFEDKLDGFHAALREQTRTYMFTMTGVMAAFASVIVAADFLG